MVHWVLRWALLLGLITVLLSLFLRFFSFLKQLLRLKSGQSRPFAVHLTSAYDKLRHSKNPQKHKEKKDWEVFASKGSSVNKLLRRPEEVVELLQKQGISLSLLLAARAAERGLFPFYSLCGAIFIDAIPQRLYHLNQQYQAVLLSHIINIPDSPVFTHVLAVYKDDEEPILAITAEINQEQDELVQMREAMDAEGSMVESSWGEQLWRDEGFSHFLCMFFQERHSRFGSSDRWSHLEIFETRALRMALETLGIETTPLMMDDGSSTKFVEMASFSNELKKDLTYCLELHGMFMMVRMALQDELTEEDVEHASLHRFRIEVYLKALASQTCIPLDLSMLMLADLKVLSEHITEHLEENELSYLDVIGPLYQEDTLFAPLEQLSWEERTQRQKRIFDNPQLLSTIRQVMSAIESSADIRLEEQSQSRILTFDV